MHSGPDWLPRPPRSIGCLSPICLGLSTRGRGFRPRWAGRRPGLNRLESTQTCHPKSPNNGFGESSHRAPSSTLEIKGDDPGPDLGRCRDAHPVTMKGQVLFSQGKDWHQRIKSGRSCIRSNPGVGLGPGGIHRECPEASPRFRQGFLPTIDFEPLLGVAGQSEFSMASSADLR